MRKTVYLSTKWQLNRIQLEYHSEWPETAAAAFKSPRTQPSSEETYLKLVQSQAGIRISQDTADWLWHWDSEWWSFSGDYLYFYPTYSVLLHRMSWEPKLLLAGRRSTVFSMAKFQEQRVTSEWGSRATAAAARHDAVGSCWFFLLPFGPDVGCVACQKAGPRGRWRPWTVNGYRMLSGWWFSWNMTFIFPDIGNNHPNWLSYFSEGFKPPTSYGSMGSLITHPKNPGICGIPGNPWCRSRSCQGWSTGRRQGNWACGDCPKKPLKQCHFRRHFHRLGGEVGLNFANFGGILDWFSMETSFLPAWRGRWTQTMRWILFRSPFLSSMRHQDTQAGCEKSAIKSSSIRWACPNWATTHLIFTGFSLPYCLGKSTSSWFSGERIVPKGNVPTRGFTLCGSTAAILRVPRFSTTSGYDITKAFAIEIPPGDLT